MVPVKRMPWSERIEMHRARWRRYYHAHRSARKLAALERMRRKRLDQRSSVR